MKRLRYLAAWILVRPRRWLFWRMVGNCYLRLTISREYGYWRFPNLHWWLLYITVFKFCKWLEWTAWRPLSVWSAKGWLEYRPWYARVIKRIGETTAGAACHGGECFHCGSKDGDQVDLADDETGETFKLQRTWTVGTMDGTDHRFCGTTICPRCGFEDYYEDGSL